MWELAKVSGCACDELLLLKNPGQWPKIEIMLQLEPLWYSLLMPHPLLLQLRLWRTGTTTCMLLTAKISMSAANLQCSGPIFAALVSLSHYHGSDRTLTSICSMSRLHMPAAPPPTPVSRGLGSPRYHGGLEGMAAPSLRYTGAHPAHIPANAFAAFIGTLTACVMWRACECTRSKGYDGFACQDSLLVHLAYCLPSGRPTLGYDPTELSCVLDMRGKLLPLGERALHVNVEIMPDAWARTHSSCLLP